MGKKEYFIIGAVSVVLLFGAGFLTGYCSRPSGDTGELDPEIRELRESIKDYERANQELQDNYQRAQAEAHRRRQEIIDEFLGAYDSLGDIGQGVQEIEDGLGGILQEMRRFAETEGYRGIPKEELENSGPD